MVNKEEREKEKKEEGRLEFSFPMLIVKTQTFNGVFDRLGKLRFSKLFSWIALLTVPVVAGSGLYLIVNNLFTLLTTPAAREITRELGVESYLLLPGVNPFLPILYGWLAIVCAIAVHEGAHGVIARNRGLNVKSSGLLFLLIIPIGAFVDVDEEELQEANPKDSLRTMAAGIGGNLAVAAICLLAVLLIVNGLTPIITGVYVAQTTEGLPAKKAGLKTGDVILSLNETQIEGYQDLKTALKDSQPGDTIRLTVARGKKWKQNFSTHLTLTEHQGKTVMGASLANLNTKQVLNLYQTVTPETLTLYLIPPSFGSGQSLVPFSDHLAPFYTHSLVSQWQAYANLFFWVWFVNINIAIFNALPIYPFDGGRMLNISLKAKLQQKMNEKNIPRITYAVTAAILSIILMTVILPYLL